MRTYTVVGLWIDDEPHVAGVYEGRYVTVDETCGDGYQRWATSVEAGDPADAEALAVAELLGEH